MSHPGTDGTGVAKERAGTLAKAGKSYGRWLGRKLLIRAIVGVVVIAVAAIYYAIKQH
jgi:hypothetical protein